MTTTTSRRAILLAGAAALPAIAAPAALAADTDVKLMRLAAQIEPLVLRYFEELTRWAPLMRSAHREAARAFGSVDYSELSLRKRREHLGILDAAAERNGCGAADERMSKLIAEIEPILEAIIELPASTLGGLRAKALAWLFEAKPLSAESMGGLEDKNDGGASRSLFDATAEITGLGPLVRSIETRLAACAQSITLADEAVQS